MSSFTKKNKQNNNNSTTIDDYLISISNKCEEKIQISKKLIKIDDENIIIPTIQTYYDIGKYNYNVQQLKIFAKHYKLKIGGNKKELITRLFNFLYLSSHIIKIQKIFRGLLQRKYIKCHGPALQNRKICTNNTDFISMEALDEIPYDQFISYKDVDDFIYGFDITSLYNSLIKSGAKFMNPYNRRTIPDFVIKNIRQIIRLSKILGIHINLEFEDDTIHVSPQKVIELRTLTLFQNIDSLGNYSNPQWFLSLQRNQIIKFIRELIDIWNYRAQILMEVKKNICPPNADPFRNLNMNYFYNESDMNNIRKVVLEVLEKFVNTGVDKDSKSLGAYYVLGALTLVNENAASSLPWLFQSFAYF